VIGESGAKDWGDNSRNNTDTTLYTEADKLWLNIVASYLRALSEKTGRQPSWFWWAWNANSGKDGAKHISQIPSAGGWLAGSLVGWLASCMIYSAPAAAIISCLVLCCGCDAVTLTQGYRW
jgi:hypothetical protein